MKDKMPWAEKKDWPKVNAELKEKTEQEIGNLAFEYDDLGVLQLEKIDKILSLMESYLSQYGLLQICIDVGTDGRYVSDRAEESVAYLFLDYETEYKVVGVGWNIALSSPTIARFDFYKDLDYMEKAQKAGREIYFALKAKHPLLTRDLYVPGYSNRKMVYEVVCEKCGMVRQRKRRCAITEHPERFTCSCGGTLTLKKN